jgi:hypothetical protein
MEQGLIAGLLSVDSARPSFEGFEWRISGLTLSLVRAFGLTWEDCEHLLDRLGYRTRVEVFASPQSVHPASDISTAPRITLQRFSISAFLLFPPGPVVSSQWSVVGGQ